MKGTEICTLTPTPRLPLLKPSGFFKPLTITNLGLAQEWCDHRSVLIYLAMKYVLRGGMVALATHRPGYRIRAQEWYGSISYSLSWRLDMHSGR
jgi:hypothetical protein